MHVYKNGDEISGSPFSSYGKAQLALGLKANNRIVARWYSYTTGSHLHQDLYFTLIMRDVNNGWLIRYTHANVASFFFIFLYIHIARGVYYGSYARPRILLWCIGVIIFVLTMATGFLGYTLPWGLAFGFITSPYAGMNVVISAGGILRDSKRSR